MTTMKGTLYVTAIVIVISVFYRQLVAHKMVISKTAIVVMNKVVITEWQIILPLNLPMA
jgi:hypothetical protein